jgi:predicted nucleotidyltransferase
MQETTRVSFDFPLPEERVFRYASMGDVLHHLVNNPHDAFTVSSLAEYTGYDESTVYRSVDLLETLGTVSVSNGRPRRISIDPEHLDRDDPLFMIPQREFRSPVRTYLERLRERIRGEDTIASLVGVVLFGSVARGDADRASDVDVLVIVEGDKTRGRRIATATARDVEDERFDGDRYEFEVLVETVESTVRVGEQLEPIFDEGLILYGSDALRPVRAAVYGSEEVSTDAD